MIWTLPNILTMARLAAAPFVAIAFAVFDRPAADAIAFVLFSGAAVTDFFDGWLARRLRQESNVGKMLDPIADKAMVIIALGALMASYDLSGWVVVPAALIVLREVMVSGLREYLGDVKLDVTTLAKWKTTLQMLAIGVLLAAPLTMETAPIETSATASIIGLALLMFAAILTLVTGWDYFRKGVAYIRSREDV